MLEKKLLVKRLILFPDGAEMIATPNSLHNDGASISFNENSIDKPLVFTEDRQMPFFHGNISREKTEKLVSKR